MNRRKILYVLALLGAGGGPFVYFSDVASSVQGSWDELVAGFSSSEDESTTNTDYAGSGFSDASQSGFSSPLAGQNGVTSFSPIAPPALPSSPVRTASQPQIIDKAPTVPFERRLTFK